MIVGLFFAEIDAELPEGFLLFAPAETSFCKNVLAPASYLLFLNMILGQGNIRLAPVSKHLALNMR